MSSSFNRQSSSYVLPFLTAAILLSSVPTMAATTAELVDCIYGSCTFSIEKQPLVSALNEFTTTTGWQVGLMDNLSKGLQSPGVRGSLSPEKALDQLLLGTDFIYRKLGNNNIILEKCAPSITLNLKQVTISATRNEQNVNRVPSTISVYDRNSLDRQNVNTIRELVRYETGVSVGGAGTRSRNAGYNIRGIDGDRILTQEDGVEVPDNFFNGPYAKTRRNYVDPEIVKSVEVLRGPASALYGSSAIGGAVSYFTLDPGDIIKPGQDFGAHLKTGYSSDDDSWLSSGTLSGRVHEVDGLLHLSHRNGHETASYKGNDCTGLARTSANPEDARTTNMLAKLGLNYGDDNHLVMTYEDYKDNRYVDLKNAIGGPFVDGKGMNFYRKRLGNDVITRKRFGLKNSLTIESPVADHISTSLNYQIANTDQATTEIYKKEIRLLRTHDTLYEENQRVFDVQLNKNLSLFETDHKVTYGITGRHQKDTSLREESESNVVKKYSDFPDPTINTYSLFAQDQIIWKKWTFLPAVRYDYTHLKPKLTKEFLNTVNPTGQYPVTDKKIMWHHVTPKLGLTYSLTDQYTWFGQYSEGFRTPSAKALYGRFENLDLGYIVEPNANLKPETSKGIETGIRSESHYGSFDIALFYNGYSKFIDEDSAVVGGTVEQFKSVNINSAHIKGAEAKGRINLGLFGSPNGLYTQGSVSYAYGRNEDNGEPLNSVNPLKGVFVLGYDHEDYGGLLIWTLVKNQNRVDSTTFHTPDGSTDGPTKTRGFGTIDLTAYYKVTNDVTINLGLYNLTDKKYWYWDDVRSYDSVGEAAVTGPANLDRLTQPGRNFAINIIFKM